MWSDTMMMSVSIFVILLRALPHSTILLGPGGNNALADYEIDFPTAWLDDVAPIDRAAQFPRGLHNFFACEFLYRADARGQHAAVEGRFPLHNSVDHGRDELFARAVVYAPGALDIGDRVAGRVGRKKRCITHVGVQSAAVFVGNLENHHLVSPAAVAA